MRNLGNSLVAINHDGELVPDLAKEIPEPTNDGQTYTFQLHEGVQFHPPYDREMTAEDVVQNFRKILDADYGALAMFNYADVLVGEGIDPEETVKATGEYEVTFELARPYTPFLKKLARTWVIIVPPEALEEHGEDFGAIETGSWGTGPYKFVEGSHGNQYVLERNENYFKEVDGQQLPYLDEIVWKPMPESATRISNIETGAVDVVETVLPEKMSSLENAENVKTESQQSTSRVNMVINQRNHGPFTKKNVRKALAYATNEEAIIQANYQGFAEPAWSPFPPWHWAYDDDAVTEYQHDPDEAQSLLEDAGESDLSFTLNPINRSEFVDLATIVQQNFSDAGIDMEVVPQEKTAATAPMQGQWDSDPVGPDSNWHGTINDLTFEFDADMYVYLTYHTNLWGNYSYYSNEQADEWIRDARFAEEQETAEEMYSNVQEQLTDDIPMIWQVWPNANQAMRSRVQNYEVFPNSRMKFESVWVSE